MLEGERVLIGPDKEKAIVLIDDGERLKVRYRAPMSGRPFWVNKEDFVLDIEP